MVTQKANVGHLKLIQVVTRPKELFGFTKISHVSSMQHKIDIPPAVNQIHDLLRLVIPALRVTNHGKTELPLPSHLLLYQPDVLLRQPRLALDARVIRVILYHLTTRQQARQGRHHRQ